MTFKDETAAYEILTSNSYPKKVLDIKKIQSNNGSGGIKKLKIIIILHTIAITITPMTIEVLLNQNNLLDLIIPPEIDSIVNSNNNNSNETSIDGNNMLNPDFKLPHPVGEPKYNPETKTIAYTFNFTNPLHTTHWGCR